MTLFSVDIRDIPRVNHDRIARAVVAGLNRGAVKARTQAARKIAAQVALPSSYLAPAGRRLWVSYKANRKDWKAVVSARRRPTSLARFLLNTPKPGRIPARVMVKPGRTKTIPRAFIVRLRRGSELTDTRHNIGLALRLRPGEVVINKKHMVPLRRGSNVYLLYGPSVQQAFLTDRETGIAVDTAPVTARETAAEIVRLLARGIF